MSTSAALFPSPMINLVTSQEIYHKSSPPRGWDGCTFGAYLRVCDLWVLSITHSKPRERSGLHSTPNLTSMVLTRRLPPSGGTVAPSVLIYVSAAYGCALAHSPQTTREVRATFYSLIGQYGPHAVSCTFCREGPCPHGPGGGPPALHARFPSVPTAGGGDLTGDLSMPHSGVRSSGGFDLGFRV
jgi:hypothetical protein